LLLFLAGTVNMTSWNYCPRNLRKATCGFVGLQNLGATCYMNSVLQQIFMVPEFRTGLLSCHVEDRGDGNENAQILFQLQRIFSYLQV
jgi:ubiquitin C-terminal hydrolase